MLHQGLQACCGPSGIDPALQRRGVILRKSRMLPEGKVRDDASLFLQMTRDLVRLRRAERVTVSQWRLDTKSRPRVSRWTDHRKSP